ncbi:unnamed protein product [Brachionus calyciflorus]|uniref:Uncharacterized protein n=1 Tax=Brachionus calyciflorus TaxID=104777 RepID=A0A813VJG5_9BILA|nr:unnamed protein product [Brachionus calyciflorus]
MRHSLEKKCVGLPVQLGYLYDVRSEKFVPMSILNSNQLDKVIIQTTDVPSIEYDYTLNDSYEEKFKKLEISPELKLDILCGLLNTGSGSVGKEIPELLRKDLRILEV